MEECFNSYDMLDARKVQFARMKLIGLAKYSGTLFMKIYQGDNLQLKHGMR